MTVLAAATGVAPPLWLVIPFGLLLACIALGPLVFPRIWHRGYPLIASGLGAISVCYYLLQRNSAPMVHAAEEYISFIALIGSLYVVSGGIHIRVKGEATPLVNCLFLLIGAVLANVIGTTGASMLLIRPWIRMNRYRITTFHVVFFIFIVSNIGGCLTPIGDPPLFLGYLKGVPFWWVLEKCWAAWLIGVLFLIGVFHALDRRNFLRAPRDVREAETTHEAWKFEGLRNLGFLALILVSIFLRNPPGLSEALMLAA